MPAQPARRGGDPAPDRARPQPPHGRLPPVRVALGPRDCTWWVAPVDGGPFRAARRGRVQPPWARLRPHPQRWRALGGPALDPALAAHAAALGCSPAELEGAMEFVVDRVPTFGAHYELEAFAPLVRRLRGGPGEGPLPEPAPAPPAACDLQPPIWLGDASCGPTLLEAPAADQAFRGWVRRRWTRVVHARCGHACALWLWDGDRRYRVQLDAAAHLPPELSRRAEPAALLLVGGRAEGGAARVVVQGFATARGELELAAAACAETELPWWFRPGPLPVAAPRSLLVRPPLPDGHEGLKLELVSDCSGPNGGVQIEQVARELRRFLEATSELCAGQPLAAPDLSGVDHALQMLHLAADLGWTAPRRRSRGAAGGAPGQGGAAPSLFGG